MERVFSEKTEKCLKELSFECQNEVLRALNNTNADEIFMGLYGSYVWIINGNVYRYFFPSPETCNGRFRVIYCKEGCDWEDLGDYTSLEAAREVRDAWKNVLMAQACLKGFTDDIEQEVEFKIIDANIDDWEEKAGSLKREFRGEQDSDRRKKMKV